MFRRRRRLSAEDQRAFEEAMRRHPATVSKQLDLGASAERLVVSAAR